MYDKIILEQNLDFHHSIPIKWAGRHRGKGHPCANLKLTLKGKSFGQFIHNSEQLQAGAPPLSTGILTTVNQTILVKTMGALEDGLPCKINK